MNELEEELFEAAKNGNIAKIKELIAKKVNVNVQDKYGWIALIWAAARDHIEGVRELIKAKADMYIEDKYGNTALMSARSKGHREIVELIENANAFKKKNKKGEKKMKNHETHLQNCQRRALSILLWFRGRQGSWPAYCKDTPWDFNEENRLKIAKIIGHSTSNCTWNGKKWKTAYNALVEYILIAS